jgi:hypothetical protein
MAAGVLLNLNPGMIVNPENPQLDLAVGPNFERFDGLTIPTDHPATSDPEAGPDGGGSPYGWNELGGSPRPGAGNTPDTQQVYTPGPIRGTVGTVDGQPLSAARVSNRIHRPPGAYTPSKTHSIQFRLGQGQNNQGAAQTVALSEITNNPPQPGDLTSIIAGLS